MNLLELLKFKQIFYFAKKSVTVKYNRTPNKKSPISERFHFFALQKPGTFHGINSSK